MNLDQIKCNKMIIQFIHTIFISFLFVPNLNKGTYYE